MKEMLLIYLVMQADGIQFVLVFPAMISSIVLMFVTIAAYVPEGSPGLRPHVKKFAPFIALLVIVAVLFPGSKTITAMLAGHAVVQAARTETAGRIAGKSVAIIEGILDKANQKLSEKE